MSTDAAIHVFVSGRVQGVGFRFFVRAKASAYGLDGFVRNLPDGRVEVVAAGERPVLKGFIENLTLQQSARPIPTPQPPPAKPSRAARTRNADLAAAAAAAEPAAGVIKKGKGKEKGKGRRPKAAIAY